MKCCKCQQEAPLVPVHYGQVKGSQGMNGYWLVCVSCRPIAIEYLKNKPNENL